MHPATVAVAAVAEPSLTATVQAAGAVNPARSTRNRPAPSLVLMATPVHGDHPVGRSRALNTQVPPLTSAREMVTAPYPDSGSQHHQHQGGSQNARHLQAPEPPASDPAWDPPRIP